MTRKIHATLHDMQFVGLKMPEEIVDHIDRTARAQLRTRSDVVRSLVVEALRYRGVVATEAEVEAAAEVAA